MADRPARARGENKRRSHKKSTKGCGNCKLRRVKCDERQPCCQKCIAFGVECTYGGGGQKEMRFAGESSFSLDEPLKLAATTSLAIATVAPTQSLVLLSFFNASGRLLGWDTPVDTQLGITDLELLAKFRERTVLSVGTKDASDIYQREIFRLACAVCLA
jgi:hypothetical protein